MEAPVAIPGLRGFFIRGHRVANRDGDVYYLRLRFRALARLCVADVTDTGNPSRPSAAGWRRSLEQYIHRASRPARCARVNRARGGSRPELMSTAVCLSYNSLNGKLAFCSAGTRPCASAARGVRVEAIARGGWALLCNVPLAVDASATYAISRCQLRPGDRLIVHTDGLTEAQDANGQLLGEAVWAAGRVPGCDAPLESVLEAIKAAVAEHVPGGAAGDDITVLVLEALPYQTSNRYALFLKNNFPRFARALLGEGRGGG